MRPLMRMMQVSDSYRDRCNILGCVMSLIMNVVHYLLKRGQDVTLLIVLLQVQIILNFEFLYLLPTYFFLYTDLFLVLLINNLMCIDLPLTLYFNFTFI